MIHGETALEAMRAELSWLDHVIESNERDIIRAQEKCDQDVSTARRIIHESIEKSDKLRRAVAVMEAEGLE